MTADLRGTLREGVFKSHERYPGAEFHYSVYLPDIAPATGGYALALTHDGLNHAEAAACETLARRDDAPPCVYIGVYPGVLRDPAGAGERGLRMNTYDMASGRYADFIVEELVPYIARAYGLRLSPSPDMRLASGGSSGGISAWNLVWHRNDFFRRAYLSSPTFSAFGGGEEIPYLIRKCEPLPIKIFCDYSEHEPDDYFGSSVTAAENFRGALRYAGYEARFEYHPGEGHCSRNGDYAHALKRLRYLWENWRSEPVRVSANLPYLDGLAGPGGWHKTEYHFPSHETVMTDRGEYRARGGSITLVTGDKERLLTDEFRGVTAIALSSDRWRLYIADRTRRCLYAATVAPDGSFSGIYTLATLHVPAECRDTGALDIAVDAGDRVYAATEAGIQCVRSFGPVDAILRGPNGGAITRLSLDAGGKLYAETRDGVYARQLRTPAADPSSPAPPRSDGYYGVG